MLMIITIGGGPGSGKGTVGKLLAAKLGYKYVSMGDIWGEAAKEKGLTLNEFHEYLHHHPEFDNEIDERQRKLGEGDEIIIDSRLGFHFVPRAHKIYLTVEENEGARRVFNTKRDDESYTSIEDARRQMHERKEHERKQHQAIYGVDSHDLKNFNLVIDTTKLTPQEIVDMILSKLPATR